MGLELLSPSELKQLVKDSETAVIEFYSPRCRHCAALEPTIRRLVEAWGDQVRIAQVDVLENPGVGDKWTILSTPTVVFLDEGEEIERLTGVQRYRQYKREVEKLVDDSDS